MRSFLECPSGDLSTASIGPTLQNDGYRSYPLFSFLTFARRLCVEQLNIRRIFELSVVALAYDLSQNTKHFQTVYELVCDEIDRASNDRAAHKEKI